MAQVVVSWFICGGKFRVHAVNAVGSCSGRLIEIEDVGSGERFMGLLAGWSEQCEHSKDVMAKKTRYWSSR